MNKKIISILISIGILCILYSKLDFTKAIHALKNISIPLALLSLSLTLPILLLGAKRLEDLLPKKSKIPFKTLFKSLCLSQSLNLFLPSKLGDFSKVWYFKREGHLTQSKALAITFLEKAFDMLNVLFPCFLGLIVTGLYKKFPILTGVIGISLLLEIVFVLSETSTKFILQKIPQKNKFFPLFKEWLRLQKEIKKHPKRYFNATLNTLFTAYLFLIQGWILFKSIAPTLPIAPTLTLVPLSVLAGLLPLTASGIGTRDAALVFLFKHYVSKETASAFGILFTLRMVGFGIPGLFYIKDYLKKSKKLK